jgi:Secretion system C-terminal sorting domain
MRSDGFFSRSCLALIVFAASVGFSQSAFASKSGTTSSIIVDGEVVVKDGLIPGGAQLFAEHLSTNQLDYAPGDSVIISGSGFWPNESIRLEVVNINTPGYGDSGGPWFVSADATGAFQGFWVVPPEGVNQLYQASAAGQSSGLVASTQFSDANTVLNFAMSMPDSGCTGQTIDICAFLQQNCGGGDYDPLPNREILFFLNSGNCGNNVSQNADDSVFTDSNGIACAQLTLPIIPGTYSIRIKFRGENKPGPSDPPNSACSPTGKTELSNANDCEEIVVANSVGSDPEVNLPPDFTVTLCGPTEICIPVEENDDDCDIDTSYSNFGPIGGSSVGFDQIDAIVKLGASITQIGGGYNGKALQLASDFVPPINSTSGVSVTLPNFVFITSVVDNGGFTLSGNQATEIVGAPTDMTFTTAGSGGPDGTAGDGSLALSGTNFVTVGTPTVVTCCGGSTSDALAFISSPIGGTAIIQCLNNGAVIYSLTTAIPSSTTGSGEGGISIDMPDGYSFNQVRVTCVSGTIEVDAIAIRTASTYNSEDHDDDDDDDDEICFLADTAGVYTIIATVEDECGNIAADTCLVTVQMNHPPVANAGIDKSIYQCTLSQYCFNVNFTDVDNNLKFKTKVSGPGTLSGNQICFTPGGPGANTFVIKAEDSCGAVDYDTVVVTVAVNSPPVAVNPASQNVFQCVATQICHTFTATDVNGGPLTWTKIAGVGTITTAGLFCFTPTLSGSYTATVVVADSCGLKDTTSIAYTVTINSAPVALNPPTPQNLSQCAATQQCFTFTASDVNGGTLVWTKLSGVGTVTSGGLWCFTPSGSGSYAVTAIVADSCGKKDTTTLTYNVTVNGAPTIAFGNDTTISLCSPISICLPYTVSDPQGLAKLQEALVSGYGTIDTALNKVCFTPASSGTYQFIASVTDSCGASDRDTINVTVTLGVAAQITCPSSPISVSLCTPGQVCAVLPISPASAVVTTSLGTYSAGQLCFTANSTGIYNIRVIATTPCGADTCDLVFNVTLGQAAQITCPPPQNVFLCSAGSVCVPVSIIGPGATVTVSPSGTYSAGTVCFTANASGTYNLQIIASTACGTDTCSLSVNVTIDSAPIATNPPASVDTFLCATANICRQFAASDVNGGTLTWTRLSGAGTVSSTGLWCFTALSSGAYSVVASVADSCGKADTVAMIYNVTLNSAPVLTLGNDTTYFMCAIGMGCKPYSVSDINNNIVSEILLSGTGTLDTVANTLCFSPVTAGTYSYVVEVTDACGLKDRDTINITISVNQPPVANAGVDQTVFQCNIAQICWPASCSDPDGNLTSCQLFSGPSGATYNGTNICFTPTGTLNYEFVLKATDMCGAVDYDTVVVYYTKNTAPVAVAGADQTLFQCTPTQICWPASCSDVDGNLTACQLISGPGSYNGSSICFTPAVSGSYVFILQAVDACGKSDLDTAVINVTLNSSPVCNLPNDTSIFQCTPAQICLPAYGTDADGNLSFCQIISGPGTLSGGNWCYTPSADASFTVTIKCQDACGAFCQSQFDVTVDINGAPSIAFGNDTTINLCASQQVCLPYTYADPDARPLTISLFSGPGTLDLLNSRVCFTPVSTGSYSFVVKIQDECGLNDFDTINVTVGLNQPPVANAGADQSLFVCTLSQICWPASCSDPDGNLVSCVFSGPGYYTGSSICFTPIGPGPYVFYLTATDSCGIVDEDTVTINIAVNGAPNIAFTGNDTTIHLCAPASQLCFPYTVSDPQGLAGLTEIMVSGYGAIDSAANKVCFTPSSAGTYPFIVQVTDPCGRTDVDTITVTIVFDNFASINCPSGPIPVSLCAPGSVCQMLAITPANATVTTTLGTYSGGQLCFNATTTGTYVATVIASSPCGADTCQITFNVTVGQSAQITCPPPTTKFICATETVCVPVSIVGAGATVTVSPIGAYSAGSVCFLADTSGHYVLTVIASTSCGADTCSLVVDVTKNSAPVAVDPPTPVDTFICAAAQICRQFSATDANGNPLVWSRQSGSGTVTPGGLWCFNANIPGTYPYTIVARVSDSCSFDVITMTYNVTINASPVVTFGNDTSIFACNTNPICVTYMVSDPNNNVTSETLISGPGTLNSGTNQVCFPATAGTHTIVVRATDACGAFDQDTIVVTISANNAPIANAGSDANIFLCAVGQVCIPASVTDVDNNLDSAGLIQGSGTFTGSEICFTPGGGGSYTFVLRAKDKCGAIDLDTVVVTVSLNVPPICNIPNDTSYFQCAPTLVSRPVGATDPNGNFDHCEILSGPGSLIGGFWKYTPSADQTVKVVIQCLDACGASCKDSFTVMFDINTPPVANAGNDTTIFLCAPGTVQLPASCSDVDNNLTNCELVSQYGTYSNGTITFNVPTGERSYLFVIKATDGCGAVDYDSSLVTINFNDPPVINMQSSFTAYIDSPGELCFDANISDPNNNLATVTVLPFGTYNSGIDQICFNADSSGTYCMYITATDACQAVTVDTVCITVVIDECLSVQIEKTHNVIQGQSNVVNIYLNGSGKDLGGFDLLVSYDATALVAQSVVPGTIFVSCQWEYFTYRNGPDGNCGNACPSGVLRIVGIGETNNGAYHPDCWFNGQTGSLAKMHFLVSDNRTLECQYVPIRFWWLDCGDNTFSSRDGDTLWVSRQVFDFELNEITDNDYGYPGFFGTHDSCLVGGGPNKPKPIRCIDYTNGGVDIVCADSIDGRGDINLNELAYEIADAVLYSNYFIYGLTVFKVNIAGQVAASDVNADGITLSVADLVYLIRVIVGDASALAKLNPNGNYSAQFDVVNGELTIAESNARIGAISVTIAGEAHPTLTRNAENMELKYSYDGTNTRVLIFNLSGKSFLEAGAVINLNGNHEVTAIEAGSFDGAVMKATVSSVPRRFELSQNYPNPFNPATTISFSLPKAAEWELNVFNVLGEQVVKFNDRSEPGVVKVEWDASRFASGVYYYRLRAGEYSATKKMVLLK